MILTPLEIRLVNTLRDRGIDAGDVRDVLLRARTGPRRAWEYRLRWRGDKYAEEWWTGMARRIGADLLAAACPPFLADDPPEGFPIAWAPEAER